VFFAPLFDTALYRLIRACFWKLNQGSPLLFRARVFPAGSGSHGESKELKSSSFIPFSQIKCQRLARFNSRSGISGNASAKTFTKKIVRTRFVFREQLNLQALMVICRFEPHAKVLQFP
jgi:hypothetical protein